MVWQAVLSLSLPGSHRLGRLVDYRSLCYLRLHDDRDILPSMRTSALNHVTRHCLWQGIGMNVPGYPPQGEILPQRMRCIPGFLIMVIYSDIACESGDTVFIQNCQVLLIKLPSQYN